MKIETLTLHSLALTLTAAAMLTTGCADDPGPNADPMETSASADGSSGNGGGEVVDAPSCGEVCDNLEACGLVVGPAHDVCMDACEEEDPSAECRQCQANGCELAACDDVCAGGGGGGGGGGDNGDNGGNGDDGGNSSEPPADVEYAGTWTLRVAYDVECEYFATVETKAIDDTFTVVLEGDNANLVVNDGSHQLRGHGDAQSLDLAGSFPLRGAWDPAMSGSKTNLSFDGYDVVSADEVAGGVFGTFDESSGAHCKILEGGTFDLTR